MEGSWLTYFHVNNLFAIFFHIFCLCKYGQVTTLRDGLTDDEKITQNLVHEMYLKPDCKSALYGIFMLQAFARPLVDAASLIGRSADRILLHAEYSCAIFTRCRFSKPSLHMSILDGGEKSGSDDNLCAIFFHLFCLCKYGQVTTLRDGIRLHLY